MTTLESNIKSRYLHVKKERFCQWDILHNIDYNGVSFKYAVILNQECDLEQDYTSFLSMGLWVLKDHDKLITNILVCPAYVADLFCSWKHLQEHKQMRIFNGPDFTKVKRNDELKRYHYLQWNDELKLPELVLDFKNFITIPRDDLYSIYNEAYHCSINELFREDLSDRFCNFLSRVWLPVLE